MGFLAYVVRGVGLLTVAPLYVSRPARRLREACDLAPSAEKPRLRTALVAHVYYLELLDEVLECFSKLGSAQLLVTTEAGKEDEIARRLRDVPGSRVVACPNRGRDIAPFLALLNDGQLDAFDVVLKLHTKKSPHLLTGDIRRRLLFTMLAGSRRRVRNILARFDDPMTGLVGWRPSWRTAKAYWMGDRLRVNRLSSQMGIRLLPRPDFFEGSMFWVRPQALVRLRALELRPEDFEVEGCGETDGQQHHAVERLFARAAVAGGYVVRDLSGHVLLGGSAA